MLKTLVTTIAFGLGIMGHAQNATTVPEGLPTETWQVEAESLASDNSSWDPVSYQCEVAIDGGRVYIKGLSEHFPDAWVEGILSGKNLRINAGQYLGVFTSSSGAFFDIYFSGFDGENTAILDAEWSYDKTARVITGDYFVTTADLTSIFALDVIRDITITGPEADGIDTVIAPAATTTSYDLSGRPATHGLTITGGRKILRY